MADNGWVLVAVGIGGPLVGAAIAYLGARHTARPAIEQALTAKFSALVDRQEREIAKLEAVAADLEVMLIRLLAWADEVSTVAERRNIAIPPRPRFDQQRRHRPMGAEPQPPQGVAR